MQKTDHLSLDGSLLRQFVIVYETGSVSGAADLLDVNQSSVSHALERLRRLVGDPLFVRSGRGIVPTPRADALVERARHMLSELEGFTANEGYDPKGDAGTFRIAAHDYEVETVLRLLLPMIREAAPGVTLQIVRAESDPVSLLRSNEVDLMIAPTHAMKEKDISHEILFTDRVVCFYDPKVRAAPTDIESFAASAHAVMVARRSWPTLIDDALAEQHLKRQICLAAPSFAMLAAMIRGTDLISTLPDLLGQTIFHDFESVAPPVDLGSFTVAQIWHARTTSSPRHTWLRGAISSCGARIRA